jgi:FMN reductase
MTEGPLLVISCSLNPESRSRRMARAAAAALERDGRAAELIDLRDVELPMCTGDDDLTVSGRELWEKIKLARAVIVAAPVYNYDVNAAAKNLVEMTGSSWEGKVVGLMGAAGGRSSYMSLMGLANSMMLDFRCWVVPRFVYATGGDLGEGEEVQAKIGTRIEQLARTTWEAAGALNAMARR